VRLYWGLFESALSLEKSPPQKYFLSILYIVVGLKMKMNIQKNINITKTIIKLDIGFVAVSDFAAFAASIYL
jgi:hypothetical protein